MSQKSVFLDIDRDRFDHADPENNILDAGVGLTEEIVRMISKEKKEPEWMLQKRLQGYALWKSRPMPTWGPNLDKLDVDKIRYYVKPDAKPSQKWEDVPADMKKTFERIGIPEAEQKFLAGVGAQYDSEVVYHKLKKEWEDKGVLFEDMDVALQKYPDLVKKYFMTQCVPVTTHKFIHLHAAVWSGGTFIYIPAGVKLSMPLQAYFRMNAKKGGQFEHTLIIVDKDAELHYIEGCSAPQYSDMSLHAGCVEIFVMDGARCRYSSVENWSRNTYNLNTKRAIVARGGIIEWVGGNLGSGITMLYPCSILKGDNSKSDHLGIAFANTGQDQDVGSKVIHIGRNTSSTIRSKSISKGGGINTFRGLVTIKKGASGSKSHMQCDGLIFGAGSVNNTIPSLNIDEEDCNCGHEATVGRISEEHIFYLMSRGLTEQEAKQLIVGGFIEPIVKELPLEYAVELNKLIAMEMENSVG